MRQRALNFLSSRDTHRYSDISSLIQPAWFNLNQPSLTWQFRDNQPPWRPGCHGAFTDTKHCPSVCILLPISPLRPSSDPCKQLPSPTPENRSVNAGFVYIHNDTCTWMCTSAHICNKHVIKPYTRKDMHAMFHTYTHTYIHTYVRTYIRMYMHTLHTCTHARMHLHIYVCIYMGRGRASREGNGASTPVVRACSRSP